MLSITATPEDVVSPHVASIQYPKYNSLAITVPILFSHFDSCFP